MSDPRTDHGQKLGNGSAPVRRPDPSPVRARSPSPARAAALARRDNEVACPYLRALIKRQTRELSCCGVLFCFFFFASGPRRPRASARNRSLRPAANAIDATSRLLDTSPVADTQAADRRRARVEGPEGHALGVVGLPDGFMRRVGAAARDEGVVAGRGGRAARARAGRPLAARPRARLRPVGAARRARACPRPWIRVASLSHRRRCAPASTTAASPSSWRSGSGEAPASR